MLTPRLSARVLGNNDVLLPAVAQFKDLAGFSKLTYVQQQQQQQQRLTPPPLCTRLSPATMCTGHY